MTTTYDERSLPSEVVFRDAKNNTVTQVIFVRDSEGRTLSEEMHSGEGSLLPEVGGTLPPEERKKLGDLYRKVFERSFSQTTYAYDAQGRVIERSHKMGSLADERKTYIYGDGEDPIEEVSENSIRHAELDENGVVRYIPDRVIVQHNRFEYVYDEHGNWIERIVSYQPEPNSTFQPSNVERRVITYHAKQTPRQ